MSSLKKLQRDHSIGELASVEAMLARLSDEDAITRMSLEGRLDELRELVAAEEEPRGQTASASLFFSGAPVIGGRGIDSEFGGKALSKFQDLVAKEYAVELGGLAQAGRVPHRDAARLHITNVVRGSFGFQLEEIAGELPLNETALKGAVTRALALMDAFAHGNDERFQEVVVGTDRRVFEAAKRFFDLMHEEHARFRALTEDFDRSFDTSDIDRAFTRGEVTTVEDVDERIRGSLMGVLPEGHQFEFFRDDPAGIIRGRVSRELSSDTLTEYNREWTNRPSIAEVSVRRVRRGGEIMRESFVLRGLASVEPTI